MHAERVSQVDDPALAQSIRHVLEVLSWSGI
jgi:hypothetical protein